MALCNCSCCDHGHYREATRSWLTPEEKKQLAARLDQRPDQSVIAYKPGKGGSQAYLPGNVMFEIANSLFGFNGWSSSVLKVENDYCAEKNGRWHVGVTAYVRISLKDGTFHEEVGYGSADNMPYRSDAVKKCIKEAVTDAKKRALRLFGNAIGLCIADKEFVSAVKRGRGEEYEGAVEAAIKKQKQQQSNDSMLQQSETNPASSDVINQISIQSNAQGVFNSKENSNAQSSRKDVPANYFKPMPIGPTTSRDHKQSAPANSIQHGPMQSGVQNYYANNSKDNAPVNQRNHPSGAVQNLQNYNQQVAAQQRNLPRNVNSSGMHQNPSNCLQQGYTKTHAGDQPHGISLNQQQMNPMDKRCSPPAVLTKGPNQFSRNSSMNQNPMPPQHRQQVSVQQNHQISSLPTGSHINAVQGPRTAQQVNRLESMRTVVNHPNNAVPQVGSHHGMTNIDASKPQKTIYDFQDLDDI